MPLQRSCLCNNKKSPAVAAWPFARYIHFDTPYIFVKSDGWTDELLNVHLRRSSKLSCGPVKTRDPSLCCLSRDSALRCKFESLMVQCCWWFRNPAITNLVCLWSPLKHNCITVMDVSQACEVYWYRLWVDYIHLYHIDFATVPGLPRQINSSKSQALQKLVGRTICILFAYYSGRSRLKYVKVLKILIFLTSLRSASSACGTFGSNRKCVSYVSTGVFPKISVIFINSTSCDTHFIRRSRWNIMEQMDDYVLLWNELDINHTSHKSDNR